jgi:acetolactate synthase small subunit
MTGYEIKYVMTGSGETKKYDRVTIWENDDYEFEHGTERAHNIIEVIELFEIIAAKYWGTYETKHSIVEIKKFER